MQMGFYFDQTRCNGCFTCIVACKDRHDIPAGPVSWRRVTTMEKGLFPDLHVAFLSTACHHCEKPACVSVCPVEAVTKREEDGIVIVDPEVCLGRDCGQCLEACPYNAPQFGLEDDAKMQKCTFCIDRLADGKKPACVDACPMRALDAGPMEDLRAKYGDIRETEGFVFSKELSPCVVFKPKIDTRGLAVQKIEAVPIYRDLGQTEG